MKFLLKFSAVILCIMLLASCGNKTLTGGVWEKDAKKAEFYPDKTVKITEQDTEKTYYYEDCTGEKNNKYIKLYENKEKAETGEFLRFVPYYIEGNILRMDGTEYEFSKK